MLVWTVGQVTPQNASGSLEFSLDSQDETFPISVSFSAAPIADISVVGVMGESGPKEYKLEAKLVTENYQII